MKSQVDLFFSAVRGTKIACQHDEDLDAIGTPNYFIVTYGVADDSPLKSEDIRRALKSLAEEAPEEFHVRFIQDSVCLIRDVKGAYCSVDSLNEQVFSQVKNAVGVDVKEVEGISIFVAKLATYARKSDRLLCPDSCSLKIAKDDDDAVNPEHDFPFFHGW